MSFYIMRQDTLIEGSRSLDGLPDHMDSSEWMQGKHMPDPAPGKKQIFELSLASGDYIGDIVDGFITLYSTDLKDSLESLGVDNIQYYACGLHDQNEDSLEGGFWIANIIGLFDCVDMQKSKTQPWVTGIGFDFLSMVINETKTNGAKIFRLKSDPTKVIINQELKNFFDETDMLVGVEFIKTEDYSDW